MTQSPHDFMVQADPHQTRLPSSSELPCSDDMPVDNENQNFIPNLLLFLLEFIWKDRVDWYFAADMGIYHTTGVSPRVPVVPDGFLSIGVERRKQSLQGKGRSSYVVWEEDYVSPILVLEVVSQTYGGEYGQKMQIYAKLGVLYYVLYNPDYWKRDQHQPLEVYKLVNGAYQLQIGEPLWMPEIGLGIGRFYQTTGSISREILTWYDASGIRYLPPEEIANQEQQRADQERQRADQEQQRANQERQARLDAVLNLLNMGLSAEQVAKALSLSVEEVQSLSN
jgi:Uma2 family endonuclease